MESISSGREFYKAHLSGLDGVMCVTSFGAVGYPPCLAFLRVRLVGAGSSTINVGCGAVLALMFSLRRGPKIALRKYIGCLANLIAPCLP